MQRGDIFHGSRGRYAVVRLAGEGGVGTVYEARAIESGATVAVKIMHGERFRITDVALERLKQEIAATLAIKSPHVVAGLDEGIRDWQPFLAMEWMAGGMLQTRIAEGTYDSQQAVRWTAHMLKGLLAVHRAGYVHRDIKPNNVLLSDNGTAKLADLGIAKRVEAAPALTLPGDHIGSLLYISAHQRSDPENATAGDDFYSLCCVLYELASGRRMHTSNPRLTYLRPPLCPIELCHLIDLGMAQSEPWDQVLGEMTLLINMDTESLDDAYDGGVLTPSRRIAVMLKDLETTYPKMASAPTTESDLLSKLLAVLQAGLEDGARELVEQGLAIAIGRDEDIDETLVFDVDLLEPLATKAKRLGVFESFTERAFGGITFEKRGEGYVLADAWGKRIAVDVSEFVDEHVTDRVFTTLDEDERRALHRLGRALALAIAVGAIEHIDELASPD